MRKVPELSLLSYVNGNDEQQVEFVNALYNGLKDYGFIILTDHTIDQKEVDRAYDLTDQLFKLPLDQKMKYYIEGLGGQRGFTPFKREHAKDNPNPDLKEFWHVGRELTSGPYKGVYPDNVWPTEIEDFKSCFMNLYQSMDKTAEILLEAIGRALDVEKGFFAEMINDGNSILRMINYPPTEGEDVANSIRAAAHEDINLITLLVGAQGAGLQLLDRDGTWLDVETRPGQIVVDTGDMMSRLTNEVLPATTHRVINPADGGSTRYSMPYFVHPHSAASLACLPSCIGEGKKYEDISAGDFLTQRLEEIGLM